MGSLKNVVFLRSGSNIKRTRTTRTRAYNKRRKFIHFSALRRTIPRIGAAAPSRGPLCRCVEYSTLVLSNRNALLFVLLRPTRQAAAAAASGGTRTAFRN